MAGEKEELALCTEKAWAVPKQCRDHSQIQWLHTRNVMDPEAAMVFITPHYIMPLLPNELQPLSWNEHSCLQRNTTFMLASKLWQLRTSNWIPTSPNANLEQISCLFWWWQTAELIEHNFWNCLFNYRNGLLFTNFSCTAESTYRKQYNTTNTA